MPKDPPFAILYADLKSGKTTDAIAAFPGGVYIAAPGALSSAEAVWGIDIPDRKDCQTFMEVREYAATLPNSTTGLIIDDATLIADRTANFFVIERKLTGFDVWGAVLRSAINMRDVLRRKGIPIVMTCHPRAAHVENGVRLRGCASFQGQCFTKIPAAADLLLRAEARPGTGGIGASGGFGWPQVYRTAWHPDWVQGSRYDTPDMSPMNLGEILRLAGFNIPRLRGLEWQEPLATVIANKLLEIGLSDESKVRAVLAKGKEAAIARFSQNTAHVYWALRDGYDRAVLKFAKDAIQTRMWGV